MIFQFSNITKRRNYLNIMGLNVSNIIVTLFGHLLSVIVCLYILCHSYIKFLQVA